MSTPDGWQVQLASFGPAPQFLVTCGRVDSDASGVLVSLEELVTVLGDSFDLLGDEVGLAPAAN